MLPFGLHVKIHRPIKKIPIRAGVHSLEDKNCIYQKMLCTPKKDTHTRKRNTKKNHTRKVK